MEHEEAASLLGAWALDALDPDEAKALEAHLAVCTQCALEADELRAAAGLLATTTTEPAPDLWDSIAGHLGQSPAEPRQPTVHAPRRPRAGHRRGRIATVVAGLALAVAGAGIGGVVALAHEVHTLNQHAASLGTAASTIAATPGTTVIDLTDSHDIPTATLALTPSGTAVLTAVRLPALSRSKTYQVWAITTQGVISIGLLGANPTVTVLHAPTRGLHAVAITAEPASGSPTPTSAPLAEARLT
ncbi:conserved hypothetical protein [Acidimicrobium ferrooxidans DSM 10331]|uniref:Regulator of SigK n=2 Tax=Acidimicrobium ferrooxidans TaxID=53635 RepID=C7M0J6_ACIFD|nr:conserved hypothetical protein [Acidimicrobium ferrooxidans DSM 10331]